MTAISNVGATVDLNLQQGADFLTTLTFQNPDGSPVDLTGCTLAAQIREGPTEVGAFSFTVAAPATGQALISLPAITLAPLQCMQNTGIDCYRWDLVLTDASGGVSRPLTGRVTVVPEVTQ